MGDHLRDLETEATVEGEVGLLGRLQICANALGVASFHHRTHQLRAHPLALMGRIRADELEVVVRLDSGVSLLQPVQQPEVGDHPGPEHADEARRVLDDGANRQLPLPRRRPDGDRFVAGRAVHQAVVPLRAGHDLEEAGGPRLGHRATEEHLEDRIICERLGKRARDGGDLADLDGQHRLGHDAHITQARRPGR